jgi:hypothetical protein
MVITDHVVGAYCHTLLWDLDKENPGRTGSDVLEEEIFQQYKES